MPSERGRPAESETFDLRCSAGCPSPFRREDGRTQDVRDLPTALVGELGGTYAVWRWLRTDATPLLALVALGALFAYAVVQTLQPEDRYGRLFAAYAGVFLIGALLWGWGVDGKIPDRFDWIGAAVVLVGVVIVLWGRQLFA